MAIRQSVRSGAGATNAGQAGEEAGWRADAIGNVLCSRHRTSPDDGIHARMVVAYARVSDGESVAFCAGARGRIARATGLFIFTSTREPDPVVTNLSAEPAWSDERQLTRFR